MCIFFRAWTTHLQALNSALESRGESLWMISSSKHFFYETKTVQSENFRIKFCSPI